MRRWGFLTTQALILIDVAQHPRSTVREIAQTVGLTERAIHSALQDLRESGIIDREREGRRNRYKLNFERLAAFRREGTAPDLVPGAFVAYLLDALLAIREETEEDSGAPGPRPA
jgi:DNA-binding transcriptional ArsR family regulator